MQQVKISTVVAILVTGVLLGTAVDAMLNLGDTFKGDIVIGGEDIVEFEGLAGDTVNVSVNAMKGESLLPNIEITAPDMSSVAELSTGKKKVSLKKVELPVTGVYQIHVTGIEGTIGAYTMKTSGKLSKGNKKKKNDSSVGNGEIQDTMFDAKSAVPDRKNPEELKSYELSGTIKSTKKSEAIPFNPTISGPSDEGGDPVVLTGFIEKTKKGEFKIKKLPLPDLGTYVLSVENAGLSGVINTNLSIKQPKLKKQVIEKAPK